MRHISSIALRIRNALRARRSRALCVILSILLLSALPFGAATFFLYRRASVFALDARSAAVEGYISKTVSTVVCDLLSDRGDCKEIIYGESGEIREIMFNEQQINALTSEAVGAISSALSGHVLVRIPSGTLTGLRVLSGRGFNINVRCTLYPSAHAEVITELTSAGINQTVHRAILRVYCGVTSVCFGESEKASFVYDFLIGETLIVGSVPLTA